MKKINNIELSKREEGRVSQVLLATRSGDWEFFRSLSDQPLEDASSMKVQFSDASDKLSDVEHFDVRVTVIENDDGTRTVLAYITAGQNDNTPITLALSSRNDSESSIINIMGIVRQPEWLSSS